MYQISINSTRIYPETGDISWNDFLCIQSNNVDFRKIFMHLYNLLFLEETNIEKYNSIMQGRKLYDYVRSTFGLCAFHVNSIIPYVKGMIKAQKTQQQENIKQIEENIKAKKDSIKKSKKQLNGLYELADRLHKCINNVKNGKKFKLTIPKNVDFVKVENNKIYVKVYNKSIRKSEFIEVTLRQFEYQYLYPKIKQTKDLIGKYKHRLENLEAKLKRANVLKRSIFGGKDFMKDYTKQKYSRTQFHDHKYYFSEYSGRCDLLYNNALLRPEYDSTTNTFTFRLTLLNGQYLYIKNVTFPYKQEDLIKTINSKSGMKNGKPVGCRISIHTDIENKPYIQITCMFDIEHTIDKINFSKGSGIVAIDFNAGHIDMTDLDEKGNLLYHKTIYYDLYGNLKANEISLRTALNEVGEYASSRNKIIVIEDLDLKELKSKNNSDRKSQRALNRCLHNLPYERYIDFVKSLSIKYGLEVIVRNPAFTSIIGELKYMNRMKLNSHIAASYVIGRRGLGFSERPLKDQRQLLETKKPLTKYSSNWAMWSTLNKMKTA